MIGHRPNEFTARRGAGGDRAARFQGSQRIRPTSVVPSDFSGPV